jgi:hypothetical protein
MSTQMLCPYESEELEGVRRVLQQIIAEAKAASVNISEDEIIERVYDLADQGERDPGKLRAAAFGR